MHQKKLLVKGTTRYNSLPIGQFVALSVVQYALPLLEQEDCVSPTYRLVPESQLP